jgi:hypothetical protein
MLSELYHLSKNIAKGQGEANLVHTDFGEPGLSTNTNLRLILGPNGTMVKLDLLDSADTKGDNHLVLWTLKKYNFKFFPAVRIDAPLISLEPSDKVWEVLKRSPKEGLLQLLSGEKKVEPIGLNGEREQAERISQWRHDESDVLGTLHEFSKSFLQLTADDASFAELMRDCLRSTLEKKGDDKLAKTFQALVCGSLKESKGKPPKIECKVQIVFDYRPKGELSGCLYTPLVQRVVLECLNNEKPSAKKAGKKVPDLPEASCAFEPDSANALTILDAPYPDWSAKPVIGKAFKPYSKFSDAPCNSRYGHADASGFPIGVETAKTIVGFASGITTEDLRGITWMGIRNGKFDTRGGKKVETFDALIAYPSFTWDELAPVSIFARPPRKEEASGDPDVENSHVSGGTIPTGFKQVAEGYIRALKEKVCGEDRNKNYVHLLLLRAISPGQVQLVYSASPTCVEFDAALDCWIKSESYLPERLLIPLPSKKAENGLGWFRPRLLFPDEAIRVFTHQWIRAGNESARIQAPPVGDIFNVFLRRDGVWEQSARELLEILMPRVEPLFIAAGQRIHLTDKSNLAEWHNFAPTTAQGKPDKTKPDPRYFLTQALSLTGTILHALNPQNAQHYMKETAYQLGRLLAAMDHLHKCYCDGERDGSYPPSLIGNGLLGRAADSPQEALAELCERGRIYLGWADTAQPKAVSEGAEAKQKIDRHNIAVFSARKLLRIFSPLCADLHQAKDLEKPMDSMAKAHLFLGYLTKILGEKEESNQTNQTTIEDQQD